MVELSPINISKFKLKHSKKYIRYHLKMQSDFLLPEIDMDALEKIIEKTENDPNEWIPFEEAMQQIHKEVFGEDL